MNPEHANTLIALSCTLILLVIALLMPWGRK